MYGLYCGYKIKNDKFKIQEVPRMSNKQRYEYDMEFINRAYWRALNIHNAENSDEYEQYYQGQFPDFTWKDFFKAMIKG